jgi:membrane-associated protein
VHEFIDLLLHVDRHLSDFVQTHGAWWVYGLLFAVVFAETGLVVTPFLPGDSLLFAAGALAASTDHVLSGPLVIGVLFGAAFLGNVVNYAIGRAIGPRVFSATDDSGISHRLLNREHLRRAHAFFEQYGGKAVILGRFVPIVRTFVPFVAGAAQMTTQAFIFYNFVGAAAWVVLCVGAGMLFGNIPVVRNNFSLVTIGIVAVSVLPVIIGLLKQRTGRQA